MTIFTYARQILLLLLTVLFCLSKLQAQCISNQDYRSKNVGGIIINDILLNGTSRLSSTELADIQSSIAGSCLDDTGDDLSSLIADQFRQHGYFEAKVEVVKVEAVDPLTVPKPVDVEADVTQGRAYVLSVIEFSGNRIFSAENLRAKFPIKSGALFNTQRIRGGLNALQRLYATEGYLDVMAVPHTELHSDRTVTLKLTVTEGKQYRMGKLDVLGKPEQAAELQSRWSLPEGSPFDQGYLDKFFKDNQNLFPSGFDENNGSRVLRNCKDATVTVLVFLGPDLNNIHLPTREVDCDKDSNSSNTHAHP